MRNKVLLNLLLIASVVALALYAHFKPWQETAPSIKLTALKRDDVTRITVEPRARETIKLEKRAGTWRIVAPLSAQADGPPVDRLIDIVNATAKQKVTNVDLAQFDLDPPTVRVTLNDETFAFGRINDITYEQYVASAEGVFLVAPLYGYGIASEASKMLSRRLLDEGEIPVAFDFGRYQVVRDANGKWTTSGAFTAASDQSFSQDDFNRWADEWRYTSALDVVPHRGAAGGQKVSVRFKDGKAVTLRILQTQPDFQLVRSDNGLRYRFGSEVGERLSDPRVVAKK